MSPWELPCGNRWCRSSSAHAHKDPELVNLPLLLWPCHGLQAPLLGDPLCPGGGWVLSKQVQCACVRVCVCVCVCVYVCVCVCVVMITNRLYLIVSHFCPRRSHKSWSSVPVTWVQGHREGPECDSKVWSNSWSPSPLLVPTDAGAGSGVPDLFSGQGGTRQIRNA